MTFVLGNRRDEFAPETFQKLEYVRNRIQQDIDRILYYARIKSSKQNYILENLSLKECCEEAVFEYERLFFEHGFIVQNESRPLRIVSDRRGLIFIISQALSNAVKYRRTDGTNPQIELYTKVDNQDNITLVIKDNGIGVKDYDLPFIFNKGFVGDAGKENKTATGMGLYLLQQIADDLNIGIKAGSEDGFELKFVFKRYEQDEEDSLNEMV
jgi:signal transduction histidine kinase